MSCNIEAVVTTLLVAYMRNMQGFSGFLILKSELCPFIRFRRVSVDAYIWSCARRARAGECVGWIMDGYRF